MALNNDKVQITAGLANTLLTDPPIGAPSVTTTTGFTDGDTAQDSYIPLNGTTPVALNSDLGGTGYIKISNPSTYDVTLSITVSGTTVTLGTLKGIPAAGNLNPKACVFPIDSGVVVKAVTTAGQTPTVGVTVVKTTQNA